MARVKDLLIHPRFRRGTLGCGAEAPKLSYWPKQCGNRGGNALAEEESLVGGYSEASVTNADVVAAAEFAVSAKEQAMREDDPWAQLALVSVTRAQQQVVAGLNFRLKLKVKANGEEKEVETVVWWQSWNEDEPYKLTAWEWK